MLNEVLKSISNGDYNLTPQNAAQATYYGKRTPEDGLINWSWHRERIYNWVRALAPPYPGAFTYCDDIKIIVSSVTFSTVGYSYNEPDGLVIGIQSGCPVVKTPNGALRLISYGSSADVKLHAGDRLSSSSSSVKE